MNDLNNRNADNLEAIANRTPLTFPYATYLDFANSRKLKITTDLIRDIDEKYFGRFDNEEEFLQAVKDDFGDYWYPTREKIFTDFVCYNKRYFKIKG